jgi:hypothetical protein
VFPTVDVYADWKEAEEAQSIAVATAAPRPSADELTRRGADLQTQYHFRYPPGELVTGRVTDENADGGQVLTDDFAPVNLYETQPVPKKKSAR